MIDCDMMTIRLLDSTIVSSILVAVVITMRPWTITASIVARDSINPVAFVRHNSKFQRAAISVHAMTRYQPIFSQSAPVTRFGTTTIRPDLSPVTTTRLMSAAGGNGKPPEILHINREQMEEIVEDYESGGREESQYCIIDVRTEDEVRSTGKISENVYTLPVQVIMQSKVFDMDPEEFEEFCQFPKPTLDETIVFTCAAGMRSVSACHFAAQSGYSKLINYTGGANEWFSPSRF